MVDLGAGEGRDVAFFAGHDLDVLVAGNALKKAEQLARERGVKLGVLRGDVNTLALPSSFGLVYSIEAIQYFPPSAARKDLLTFESGPPRGASTLSSRSWTTRTSRRPRTGGRTSNPYGPDELPRYYAGWRILYSRSLVFDDDPGGIPHRHAAEEYVFEKP